MLPEYILDEDEKVIVSSKFGMGVFIFWLLFLIFFLAVWAFLMCCYIFEHDTEALLVSYTILPFLLLILGLILAQNNKKVYLTNQNVIIEELGSFKKIKFEDITHLKGFLSPRGVVECLEIKFADKRVVFININGYEIEQKFKELCPSYQEPERDWDKKALWLAIVILIMVFAPLIYIVFQLLTP